MTAKRTQSDLPRRISQSSVQQGICWSKQMPGIGGNQPKHDHLTFPFNGRGLPVPTHKPLMITYADKKTLISTGKTN